jgi:hypothetical protein
MNKLKEFKQKVMDQFSSEITDNVFLMIQNDKDLLFEYLKLLEGHKLNILNSSIAKEIKKRYNLDNKDLIIENPKSLLIQTHQSFKAK